MNKREFGELSDGKIVYAYTLSHKNGMSATILDYGCTLQSLCVKSKNNEIVDVVLGYDDIQGYEQNAYYFGATVGRYANRIANGTFVLNNKTYNLAINNGPNHLHGGICGFDKKIWNVTTFDNDSVTLECFSKDDEEGYPGNLTVSVTIKFTDNGELSLTYTAICDKDTPLALTNHTYFNLNLNDSATEQMLKLNANHFTENDQNGIPTGKFIDVVDTPFDFTIPKTIGRDINSSHPQITVGNGYDHNFCLENNGDLYEFAKLFSSDTGIVMTASTTEPGVQIYTANFVEPHVGKNSKIYDRRSAICLETQKYPNSPNITDFPNCILRKNEKFTSKTIYSFDIF